MSSQKFSGRRRLVASEPIRHHLDDHDVEKNAASSGHDPRAHQNRPSRRGRRGDLADGHKRQSNEHNGFVPKPCADSATRKRETGRCQRC